MLARSSINRETLLLGRVLTETSSCAMAKVEIASTWTPRSQTCGWGATEPLETFGVVFPPT